MLVQNQPEMLGEMVNLSNTMDQPLGTDSQTAYQRRSSIIYTVPEHNDEDSATIAQCSEKVLDSAHKEDNSTPLEKQVTNDTHLDGESLLHAKISIFSPKLKEQRRKVEIKFIVTILVFAIFIFTIFTLYYGSTVDTEKYYPNLKFLAVLQNDTLTSEMEQNHIRSLTSVMQQMIDDTPGRWSVYNSTTFAQKYNVAPTESSIDAKIIERIYHEYFWVSVNIRPNSTLQLYQSIVNNSAPPFNATDMFEIIYETGRDPTNIPSSILPIIQGLEARFKAYYYETYLRDFLTNVTESNITITSNVQHLVWMGDIGFNYIDYRPFYRRGLLTPTQIGVIDGLLLTIFQFLIYSPLHMEMAKLLCARNYIIYRLLIAIITFFFISLFYCSIPGFYGYDYGKAFGRGGFMVYWMSTWLYMVACGGANENIISLIFLWRPEFMGFWITTFVMLNVAPSFFPMALDSPFYRYGYAMPIHNAIDIFRVIFLDTSKRHMGRNYGVLVAWIVVNTLLCPIILRFIDKTNRRRQEEVDQKN